MQILCKYQANFRLISGKSQTNLRQISGKFYANLMQISCKSHTKLMQISCIFYTNLAQISLISHSNLIQISCKSPANLIYIWNKSHWDEDALIQSLIICVVFLLQQICCLCRTHPPQWPPWQWILWAVHLFPKLSFWSKIIFLSALNIFCPKVQKAPS